MSEGRGRLEGKVAIVTGAARGQGEAEARLFAAEGAKVVLADLLVDEGEAVAADIGDAARFVRLDVTDEEGWQAAVAFAEEAFGPVTVLVNNAGILDFNAIDRYEAARFRQVLDINVVGVILMQRSEGGGLGVGGSSAGLMTARGAAD